MFPLLRESRSPLGPGKPFCQSLCSLDITWGSKKGRDSLLSSPLPSPSSKTASRILKQHSAIHHQLIFNPSLLTSTTATTLGSADSSKVLHHCRIYRTAREQNCSRMANDQDTSYAVAADREHGTGQRDGIGGISGLTLGEGTWGDWDQLEGGPRNRRAISLSPRALAGESPPAVAKGPPGGGRRAPARRLRSCSKPGPGRSGDGRSDSATVRGVVPPSEPSSDTVRSLRSGGTCLLGGNFGGDSLLRPGVGPKDWDKQDTRHCILYTRQYSAQNMKHCLF